MAERNPKQNIWRRRALYPDSLGGVTALEIALDKVFENDYSLHKKGRNISISKVKKEYAKLEKEYEDLLDQQKIGNIHFIGPFHKMCMKIYGMDIPTALAYCKALVKKPFEFLPMILHAGIFKEIFGNDFTAWQYLSDLKQYVETIGGLCGYPASEDFSVTRTSLEKNIENVHQALTSSVNEDYSTIAGTASLCEVPCDINDAAAVLFHKLVNAKYQEKKTVLHYAVAQNDKVVIKALIKEGVDVHAVDEEKKTALRFAVLANFSKDVAFLKTGVDISAVDETKKTALHYAAECHSAKIVQILIDAGADVSTINKDRVGDLSRFVAPGDFSVMYTPTLFQAGESVDKVLTSYMNKEYIATVITASLREIAGGATKNDAAVLNQATRFLLTQMDVRIRDIATDYADSHADDEVRIWLPEISKYLHCEQERSNPEDKCCLALVMCAINLPVRFWILNHSRKVGAYSLWKTYSRQSTFNVWGTFFYQQTLNIRSTLNDQETFSNQRMYSLPRAFYQETFSNQRMYSLPRAFRKPSTFSVQMTLSKTALQEKIITMKRMFSMNNMDNENFRDVKMLTHFGQGKLLCHEDGSTIPMPDSVKEVGIHVGISSMIDRFLFEANTNLPLFHSVETSESITESLLFVSKGQMDYLHHKDMTENTYRENSETISRLLTASKDWMSVLLHEDTVEHRVRKIFKPLFVNIHSRHTTDVTDCKLFKKSLELGINENTIERPENCLKNVKHHEFLMQQPECAQEYPLMMSFSNFEF